MPKVSPEKSIGTGCPDHVRFTYWEEWMIPRTRLFRGLALVAALGVGLTACDGDDIIVPVEPTISAQPSQLNLRPGETQRVVATITGLDNTAATFESTNSSVATVDADGNVTGVNEGVATITVASVERPSLRTGVGVRVEAQQLPPTEEPSVVIEGLTASGTIFPVDPDSVVGQIDITMAIERGSADELRVRLNGQTIDACSQTFDAAGNITAEDLRIGAVVQTVVCSVNTRAFTREGNRGIPTYPNGALTVEVELLDDGATIASAQRAGFTLQNADFMVAEVAATNPVTGAPRDPVIGDTGLLWFGNGNLQFTVIPVIYSAEDETSSGYPAQVTISVDGFVSGSGVTRTQTSDELVDGGFVVTFPRELEPDSDNVTSFNTGRAGSRINVASVTVGGQPGPATHYHPSEGTPTEDNRVSFVELQSGTALQNSILRFDNELPEAGRLILVRHPAVLRVWARNGWVNDEVNFYDGKDGQHDAPFSPGGAVGPRGTSASTAFPDLTALPGDAIHGVGLAQDPVEIFALRVSPTDTTPTAATVVSSGELLPDEPGASARLEETLTNEEYVVVARVKDRLENASTVFLTRSDDLIAAIDTSVNNSQTGSLNRIGVDFQGAGIAVTSKIDTPYNPVDSVAIQVTDTSTDPSAAGPSGIAVTRLTLVSYACPTGQNQCAPANATDVEIGDTVLAVPGNTDSGEVHPIGTFVAPFGRDLEDILDNGYHRFDGRVWDRAGNVTGPLPTSVFIRDADTDQLENNGIIVEIPPTVSNVNIPTVAQFVGGQDYSFSARVMDNVDLRRATAGFDFITGAADTIQLPFDIIPLTAFGPDAIVRDSVLSQQVTYIRTLSVLEDSATIDPNAENLQPEFARFVAWDHSLPLGAFSTQSNNIVENTRDDGTFPWFQDPVDPNYGLNRTDWESSGTTTRWVVFGETGTFQNPFEEVLFYARIDDAASDYDGMFYLIGSATDVAVQDTGADVDGRIWRFTAPTIPTAIQALTYKLVAVGITADGDALMSTDAP